ncbi:hypothetical protein FRB96_004095 [Tulasnella sp. 330]|nr:hypothetical protein FRB96_004095 [Tulasnella sp. 330]
MQFALTVDREDQDTWMAKYAYGCLKDEALKWFETIDPELRGKWITLRELLIAQFGNPRIKVLRSNGTQIGYVGYLSPATETRFEKSVSDALVLHMPLVAPQQGMYLSYVTNPDVDKSHFPFVGMEHMEKGWWTLRAVDGEKPRARAFSNTGKESSGDIWSLRISEGSEELNVQWTDDNHGEYHSNGSQPMEAL